MPSNVARSAATCPFSTAGGAFARRLGDARVAARPHGGRDRRPLATLEISCHHPGRCALRRGSRASPVPPELARTRTDRSESRVSHEVLVAHQGEGAGGGLAVAPSSIPSSQSRAASAICRRRSRPPPVRARRRGRRARGERNGPREAPRRRGASCARTKATCRPSGACPASRRRGRRRRAARRRRSADRCGRHAELVRVEPVVGPAAMGSEQLEDGVGGLRHRRTP